MTKKSLPQIKTPEYSVTLPLSGEKVRFRPYNVGDEKILLQASSAKDQDNTFYVNNTLNVIRGSILDDSVNIDSIPSIDIKYLLLQQRSKSVGEEIEFSYDGVPTSVNINDFVVVNPRKSEDFKIDIGGGVGIQMREVTFSEEINSATKSENEVDAFYELILHSIKSIYTDEDVWVVGQDITREELEEFIKPIPTTESKKLYEFVTNGPYIAVKANINGKEVELTSKEVDFLA